MYDSIKTEAGTFKCRGYEWNGNVQKIPREAEIRKFSKETGILRNGTGGNKLTEGLEPNV